LVEYFAFFYFSYYFILIAYIGTILWTSRRPEANTELAVGAFTVMVFGHLGYMAVPGFGPVTYMADQFTAPLQGGFFWSCVWNTVQAGGAQKDIFPSLHTAFPTYFALYALHQSRIDRRWRWPAIITGFFAANIIISTVFLRWHYAIDLFAGLALASFAAWLGPRLAQWDVRFREARGLPPAWSFDAR
jgi:membrane-associated phospholipid phosphatase